MPTLQDLINRVASGGKTAFNTLTNLGQQMNQVNRDFTFGMAKKIISAPVNAVKGTYQAGNAIISGEMAKKNATASLNRQMQIADNQVYNPQFNRSQYQVMQNNALSARNAFSNWNKNSITQQQEYDLAKKTGLAGLQTILLSKGLGAPKIAATNAIMGIPFAAGGAVLTGQNIPRAIGESIGGAPYLAGVLRYTNPATEKILGKVVGGKLTAPIKIAGASGANVIEDNIYTFITEGRLQSGKENVLSGITGAGMQTGSELLGVIRKSGISPKEMDDIVRTKPLTGIRESDIMTQRAQWLEKHNKTMVTIPSDYGESKSINKFYSIYKQLQEMGGGKTKQQKLINQSTNRINILKQNRAFLEQSGINVDRLIAEYRIRKVGQFAKQNQGFIRPDMGIGGNEVKVGSSKYTPQAYADKAVDNLRSEFNITPQEEINIRKMLTGSIEDMDKVYVRIKDIYTKRAQLNKPTVPTLDEVLQSRAAQLQNKQSPKMDAKILRQNIEQALVGQMGKGEEVKMKQALDWYEKRLGVARLHEAYEGFLARPKDYSVTGFWDYLKKLDNKIPFPSSPDIPRGEVKVEPPIKIKTEPTVKVVNKTFEQKVMDAKTPEEIENIRLNGITAGIEQIKAKFEANGKTWDQVVDELEQGIDNTDTKQLKKWFDIWVKRAEMDGIKVNRLDPESYYTHITAENAEDILLNGATPDTFGSIMSKPYFAETRKGTLETYDKSEKSAIAYALAAMKNADLSAEAKADIKLAQDIVEHAKVTSELDSVTTAKKFDLVSALEKKSKKGTYRRSYDESNAGSSAKFRSTSDRAEMIGTTKKNQGTTDFWNDFIYPFRKAEMDFNAEVTKIQSLYGKGGQLEGKATQDQIASYILKARREVFKKAFDQFKANVEKANFRNQNTKNLINDIFDEFGVQEIRKQGLVQKMMGLIRSGSGRGALGLNVASSIQNIFEIKRALALTDRKVWAEGFKQLAGGRDFVSEYKMNPEFKTALERKYNQGIISQILQKTDRALFAMFDASERLKDNVTLAMFDAQGRQKGLKDEALTKYVLQKFDQYAFKYGKGSDIGLFKNDLLKTLFQFQQYGIKDAVTLFDKAKGAVKGDKGDLSYLAKYTLMTIGQAILFKQALGMIGFGGNTGTPIDIVTNLQEGQLPVSPLVQTPIQLGVYLYEKNKNEDSYQTFQAKRNIIRSGMTMAVPASNQLIFKSGAQVALGSDAIDKLLPYGYGEARKRGYYETYTGKVANEVGTSPTDTIKGSIFGPSYDSKRQDYIAQQKQGYFPSLSTKQTETYKSLPKESRSTYYEDKKMYDKITVDKTKNLSPEDKRTWEMLRYSPTGVISPQQKAMIMLNNPNIQAVEMDIAKATGKVYDPIWDLTQSQRQQVFASRTSLPGDKTYEDKYLKDQPWYQNYQVKNAEFWKQLVNEPGMESSGVDDGRPQPSPEIQKAMNEKNWTYPGVREYLDAYKVWTNQQREKVGLLPMESTGFTPYKKKVTYKKIKAVTLPSSKFKTNIKQRKLKPIKIKKIPSGKLNTKRSIIIK